MKHRIRSETSDAFPPEETAHDIRQQFGRHYVVSGSIRCLPIISDVFHFTATLNYDVNKVRTLYMLCNIKVEARHPACDKRLSASGNLLLQWQINCLYKNRHGRCTVLRNWNKNWVTVRDKCPQINVQFKWHTLKKIRTDGQTNGQI